MKRAAPRWLVVLAVAVGASPTAGLAQASLPRITFGGTGLVSFNVDATTAFAAGAADNTSVGTVNDFSDSFLMLRLDRQLYEKQRAGMIVSFLFPDARAGLGDVFYNQVMVFYRSSVFDGMLGRSRLNNFLLEFPTLREEDLLEYSFVRNGFANADNSEFSRYGNVLRGQLFQFNGRFTLAAQATNWTVTDAAGTKLDDFEVNGLSATAAYHLPDAVRYTGALRFVGVQVASQNIDVANRAWIHSVLGAIALNVMRNPLANLEARIQAIYNFGVGTAGSGAPPVPGLGAVVGRAQAKSLSVTGSLRFLRRPYQLDRFQAAVTGAYKEFPDQSVSQFTIVPNAFYRLGQGVDVGLQYQFEQFSDALASVMGRKRSHSVKFTMAFRFQTMFNNYFGERDDILSLEHGYIP
jgi:hypothetical protein